MAFSINSYELPPIRNYSDARLRWSNTKPWRGASDTNARPIADRKKKGQTIRQTSDGSMALRLYRTDVVTYHTDGTITLEAYNSQSTDAFARALTPSGIYPWFNSAAGSILGFDTGAPRGFGTRMYLLANRRITIKRNEAGVWEPANLDETTPFIKYSVDIAKRNATAKQLQVADFKTWLLARVGLEDRKYAPFYSVCFADYADIIRDLKDIERWEKLYQMYGSGADMIVNNAVLVHGECIRQTELPYVESYSAIYAVRASARKYAHLCD